MTQKEYIDFNIANKGKVWGGVPENPKTIQEKLRWLNIYDVPMSEKYDLPLKTICADKLRLREYCKDILGKDICIPLLKSYNNTKEINLDELPDKFALKCNHGSGMNIICKDKKRFNKNIEFSKLDNWMKQDYAFRNGFESHYHWVERKIVAEPYMSDDAKDSKLTDYKFWCFNGKPGFIHVVDDRYSKLMHFNFYSPDFKVIPLEQTNHPKSNYVIPTPKNIKLMNEYAEKLSNDFKFARVDFYEINGKVYLGEITFVPDVAVFNYKNPEDNLIIGNLLKIK